MRITLVAALDHHHLIGDGEEIPWRLPSDWQRFKSMTMGHPLVMGRRTHESIGKALPGRLNIVLTRDQDYEPAPGCVVAHSTEEACRLARSAEGGQELMIGGGSGVYLEFLPRADRLWLSVVHGEFEGDVYFPAFDLEQWTIVEEDHVPADERHSHAYTFYGLERRPEVSEPTARDHDGEPLPARLRRP